MSLTSRGAALLAFVSLLGEVLASYGWLGLKQTSAAAFLVVFVAAVVMFFVGMAFLNPWRGMQSTGRPERQMPREAPPLQGWQVVEERTYRTERRVLIGRGLPEEDPTYRALLEQASERGVLIEKASHEGQPGYLARHKARDE